MSDEQIPPVEPQSDAPKETGTTPPPPSQTVDLDELKTILSGLPESIANAVREAIPAPPKPTPVKRDTPAKKAEVPAPVADTPPAQPQKKTLAQWWFDK